MSAYRCPPTGCMDDICHGAQRCMLTDYPLAQRCSICGVAVIDEFAEECACDCAEWDDDDHEAYAQMYEDEA